MEQCGPLHMSSHTHVGIPVATLSVHSPFMHPRQGEVATEHASPEKPRWQAHTPLVQTPWPEQAAGQAVALTTPQSAPSYPSVHSHT